MCALLGERRRWLIIIIARHGQGSTRSSLTDLQIGTKGKDQGLQSQWQSWLGCTVLGTRLTVLVGLPIPLGGGHSSAMCIPVMIAPHSHLSVSEGHILLK